MMKISCTEKSGLKSSELAAAADTGTHTGEDLVRVITRDDWNPRVVPIPGWPIPVGPVLARLAA